MDIYKIELMEHYRNSKFRGTLENPDISIKNLNPSCGDEVSLEATVINGRIENIKFEGKGCVISQAAASMLSQNCLNRTIDDLETLDKTYMLKLVGIPIGPTRLRCALLIMEALHEGIKEYKKKVGYAKPS